MAEDTRASDSEFNLDVNNFENVAKQLRQIAKQLKEFRLEMDRCKTEALYTWAGIGRDTFEKKYRLLTQQVSDINDELEEYANNLYKMEQEYIQADVELAKAVDGKNNRKFTGSQEAS